MAKRVRSETGIGQMAVSVSYAAVELARKIFGSLANRSVLIVGSGKMSELAARHLHRSGANAGFRHQPHVRAGAADGRSCSRARPSNIRDFIGLCRKSIS